jgi:cytochrome c oxidase subunit 3
MAGAGEVLAERAERARSHVTAYVGMIAFLASWAMLFAGLFFAFGLARVRAEAWPPESVPALPLGLPGLNTFVLALSSLALVVGLGAARRGRSERLAPWLCVATVLGGLFLGLQVMLWSDMWAAGLRPSSGQYGSLFYALTWVHAAHVGIGLFALVFVSIRALVGAYSPARHLSVRLWSWYWHFVGVVWGLMFVTIFVS